MPSFADATPAEVRAALIPEEAADFDQQWREVMAAATEALDRSEVLATLESWRRAARLIAVTGPEAHPGHVSPCGGPVGWGGHPG